LQNHETVSLDHPSGTGTVEVDKAIAPLVSACWDAEIWTSESCQEAAPGMARIGFQSLDDMERFYNLVSDGNDDIFYGWKWDLWADGGLLGSLHLPVSEVAEVASRLRRMAGK
jgi:hypothetical protein